MNLDAVKALALEPIAHSYDDKDAMLYALGLGYGDNPTDQGELQFVYEQGLKAVPSICVVLAHPGFWISQPRLEIDWLKVLHGEQAFELYRPLPATGTVRGEYAVSAVQDKGDKGAVMHVAKKLYDNATNTLLANVTSVYMLRGDGGCGAFGVPPPPLDQMPEGEPDWVYDVATLPQAALIYRLSGDRNPIHADPKAAQKSGFPKPILHGLCSMGLATRAVVATAAEGDPARLKTLSVRFSSPVFPGETLRVSVYRDGDRLRFSARVIERDLLVLDRGTATLTH